MIQSAADGSMEYRRGWQLPPFCSSPVYPVFFCRSAQPPVSSPVAITRPLQLRCHSWILLWQHGSCVLPPGNGLLQSPSPISSYLLRKCALHYQFVKFQGPGTPLQSLLVTMCRRRWPRSQTNVAWQLELHHSSCLSICIWLHVAWCGQSHWRSSLTPCKERSPSFFWYLQDLKWLAPGILSFRFAVTVMLMSSKPAMWASTPSDMYHCCQQCRARSRPSCGCVAALVHAGFAWSPPPSPQHN